jgi:simple sugar transport system permease protein
MGGCFVKSALLAVVGLGAILTLVLALFGLDVGQSLGYLFQGGLGSEAGIARTLVKAAPLLLCALGLAIAWRAGMFNIGGEGQYVAGALCGAALFRLAPGLPPGVLNPLILVATVLGGMAVAWAAAVLQVKRGVQVVISTILINFLVAEAAGWAVRGPLQEPKGALPKTETLPNEVMLQRFNPQTDLHSGVFLAVVAALVVWAFLFRSKAGFQLRVTGASPTAARASRIPAERRQVQAMLWSGGLCGLAGGIDYLGVVGSVSDGFSQNWGFLAIPVALLGMLHPAGIALSALFFGFLLAGSDRLASRTDVGASIVFVVQAAAVLAYVAYAAWRERRQEASHA